MLRGIIFDLDGVIVDSHQAHLAAWKAFLRSVGIEVSDRDLAFVCDGHKREEILEHFLGKLDPALIVEYGNRKDELLRAGATRPQPMAGVANLLAQLMKSRIRMGLATCASRIRAIDTLRRLNLRDYFEVIVTGDDVDAGKPDPAIYRLAVLRMQESPDRLLAVEDAASGVNAARAAGLRCLGIAQESGAHLLRSAGADPVCDTLGTLSVAYLKSTF